MEDIMFNGPNNNGWKLCNTLLKKVMFWALLKTLDKKDVTHPLFKAERSDEM